jgi:hypothetical protein
MFHAENASHESDTAEFNILSEEDIYEEKLDLVVSIKSDNSYNSSSDS